MNQDKLLVVICVTAGKQDLIVNSIRDVLDESERKYRIIKIQSPPEVIDVLKKVKISSYGAAAIYGGDGTVIAALKAFGQKQVPILMLPGGTANVLTKYYGLPDTAEDCLKIYLSNTYVINTVDIATVNDDPLILDMHMGFWTEAIKSTSRKFKKQVGEAAYAWSALKSASGAPQQTYEFAINSGEKKLVHGYTFIVANQGNHNILGVPLFPRDHAPGLVQIAVIKSVKIRHLIAWFFYRLFSKNLNSVIEVYRARTITIYKAPKSTLSDDDSRRLSLPIVITGGEFSAKVIVPPSPADTTKRKKLKRRLLLWLHRNGQRFQIFANGSPDLRYTHVAPNIYLGGKYSSKTYKLFESWGITGIVSMRTSKSPPSPPNIEQLSLPTKDWSPPTLKNLDKGVSFIKKHIADGGSVYIHCQLGEGRGPSMAAAYLISKGFSVDEAINHLAKYRPAVQPNEAQRKRLAEWQEYYNSKTTR